MKTTGIKDPKDEQITNEDNSVTNKDGNNDLEQGKAHNQQDVDEQPVTFNATVESLKMMLPQIKTKDPREKICKNRTCHSERSEESPGRRLKSLKILRYAQDNNKNK